MLERKSILDKIEITRDGSMQVRIGLLIMDGDKEVGCKWHRYALPADDSIPADAVYLQMDAVNANLVQMGEEPVGQVCIDNMKAAHDLARVVAANPAVPKAKGE